MKLSIAIATILFAIVGQVSATEPFGIAAFTVDPEKHRDGDCAGFDDLIESAMNEVMIDSNPEVFGGDDRRLQGHLSLRCRLLCAYWAPGTCHRAYPKCYPLRRDLKEREGSLRGRKEFGLDERSENVPEVSHEFEEFNSVECARAIVAVEEKLLEIAPSVDNPLCQEYLNDGHSFKCFRAKVE